MCIIIAKTKRGRIPTINELENCYKNNDDGAGFMYLKNNKVVIDKGYMTKDAFINHYKKLCVKFNDFKDLPLVIHCRIGTAGTNTAQNTHPYPISNSIKKLHKTYTTASVGIAHNGIISDYQPASKDNDTNDTQEFISRFLSALHNRCNRFYTSKEIRDAIARLTSSKFAILNKDGELYTIGDFVEESDGLYFSNTTYQASRYSYYNWRDWENYYSTYYNDDASHSTLPTYEEQDDGDPADDEEYINYRDLSYIPETYLIEYDDEIHDASEEIYYINSKDDALYIYSIDDDAYKLITNDYILYDEALQPAVLV